jgi:hypothetical protein
VLSRASMDLCRPWPTDRSASSSFLHSVLALLCLDFWREGWFGGEGERKEGEKGDEMRREPTSGPPACCNGPPGPLVSSLRVAAGQLHAFARMRADIRACFLLSCRMTRSRTWVSACTACSCKRLHFSEAPCASLHASLRNAERAGAQEARSQPSIQPMTHFFATPTVCRRRSVSLSSVGSGNLAPEAPNPT